MAASVARHILAPIWYTASDKKPIPTQGREKLDAQGKPTSVDGRNPTSADMELTVCQASQMLQEFCTVYII